MLLVTIENNQLNRSTNLNQPKPRKTNQMSKVYFENDRALSVTKSQSRKKVARSMQASITGENILVHYLGGTSTQTPFEDEFTKGTPFVRYEKMRSITPSGYSRVYFDKNIGNHYVIDNRKKYFVNGNFWDSVFDMNRILKNREYHYWLDFCGTPKQELLDCLYDTFMVDGGEPFKTLYITFFMNPRNAKDVKQFIGKEKTLEERADSFLNKLKVKWEWETQTDKTIEIFDTYYNGHSPMCILKIERREKENDMTKTASIENYVRLHQRGFSNKQIAIFWRAGIMQVAGFAAQAKRKKMI